MISTWQFNIVVYILTATLFTQFYKLAVKELKVDGAATIILQTMAGLIVMILSPLFPWSFPTDWRIYGLLVLASVFYAINDRLQTTIRKNLSVSEFSILSQFAKVWLILIGIFIYREGFTLIKLVGAGLILLANILVVYKRGKFEFNLSVALSLMANAAIAIAISIDVGISRQFNLPFYIMLTLIIPTLMIWLVERIPVSEILNELKKTTAKYYILTSLCWSLLIVSMLRSYQFGSVTLITPLSATTVILNVLISTIFFGERGNLIKKTIAASLTTAGVVLTVL